MIICFLLRYNTTKIKGIINSYLHNTVLAVHFEASQMGEKLKQFLTAPPLGEKKEMKTITYKLSFASCANKYLKS